MNPFCFPVVFLIAFLLPGGSASPAGGENLLVHAHSHNDYTRDRPLRDALEEGFHSVEADIWLEGGEIVVGHNQGEYRGSLEELYLKPLARRIDKTGTVQADGKPFYLWIDIKDPRPELRPALHNLLSRYPIFTVFTDERIEEKPVTVILTGDAGSKKAYVEEFATRLACRDSNRYSNNDPPADNKWRWYALRWWSYVEWDGKGTIPPAEREKLERMVKAIHSKGKRVRFYSTPEQEGYWNLALELGIDLINTDRLSRVGSFLRGSSR